MKAYGKPKAECAGRTIRGTSRPCPCCTRKHNVDANKTARQQGKKLTNDPEC